MRFTELKYLNSKKSEWACKPGFVLLGKAQKQQSFLYDDSYLPPEAAHPKRNRGGSPQAAVSSGLFSVWPCSRWGLPSQAGHPACW